MKDKLCEWSTRQDLALKGGACPPWSEEYGWPGPAVHGQPPHTSPLFSSPSSAWRGFKVASSTDFK